MEAWAPLNRGQRLDHANGKDDTRIEAITFKPIEIESDGPVERVGVPAARLVCSQGRDASRSAREIQ